MRNEGERERGKFAELWQIKGGTKSDEAGGREIGRDSEH